jgi:hypothetical protein
MVRNIHFTYFANNPTETKPSATRKAVTLFGHPERSLRHSKAN